MEESREQAKGSRWPSAAIREALIPIFIKGSARGNGGTLSREEAEAAIDSMIRSDEAPEWSAIRQGEEELRRLIGALRFKRAQEASAR